MGGINGKESGNPEQIEGGDNILLSCKTKYIILFAKCC